jgi:hypothetical protein
MEKIEPEVFDIIVVGSGLVEGLLAGQVSCNLAFVYFATLPAWTIRTPVFN